MEFGIGFIVGGAIAGTAVGFAVRYQVKQRFLALVEREQAAFAVSMTQIHNVFDRIKAAL